MSVSASGAHFRGNPDGFHYFLGCRPMAQSCAGMAADAIWALRHMGDRNRDQLLCLCRNRTFSEHALAEDLEGLGRFRAFNALADLEGVRLVVDEARSWFARARAHETFDLIQMSMIDTWAATGAGAFALSENGLYTIEGWRTFVATLSPGGIFTVSRWYAGDNVEETARILSLAVATLHAMGHARPADHILWPLIGWLPG